MRKSLFLVERSTVCNRTQVSFETFENESSGGCSCHFVFSLSER